MGHEMLYAILICTDPRCAEEFEAWGEPGDFDSLLCDRCNSALEAVGFSEISRAAVTQPHRMPYVQQRRAA